MEYGLLHDIFPDWKRTMDGSIEAAGAVARKEQKKKAKKCKSPALRYLDPEYKDEEVGADLRDPDRPFLPVNKETSIVEATRPPGKVVGTNNKPSYFGASEDDDISEGFATFTNIIGDNPAYMLAPAKDNVEAEVKSVMDKSSGGSLLPSPSLQDAWKPLAPAGVHTSYFEKLKAPGGEYPKVRPAEEDISKKIDHIFKRLEMLETERRQSTQTEVLLFVGSGLVLLLSLDILSRK
jgi:hypothetical protein